MLLVAFAAGLAFSAADDGQWRAKEVRKPAPVEPSAEEWDDEPSPPKRPTKTLKPSLRTISATPKAEAVDQSKAKKTQKSRASAEAAAPAKSTSEKKAAPSSERRVAEIVEGDDDAGLPMLPPTTNSLRLASFETPQDEKEGSAAKLPALPKGLKPPKTVEVGPNEAAAKSENPPAVKAPQKQLPTLPKIGTSTPTPPPTKQVETSPAPTTPKPIAAPIPPPTTGPAPLIPSSNDAARLAPVPQSPIQAPPPAMTPPPMVEATLTGHGAPEENAIDFCMPLMDAASVWRAEARTLLLWWDQPGTHSFVRDAVTDAPILGGVDYDFEKRFAQELSLERRFDAASAMVIRGFVTEDSRQSVGAAAFNGLDLGIDGPGSGAFRSFSGFSGRATSRVWKVDLDFVQHYLARPDSPVRGRFFFGPQFIGLKETFGYRADGAGGVAEFDARAINTLFGADAGFGVTFQPWYSALGIDVSGRYGLFGNIFDVRNSLVGPAGSFVGAGDDGASRFATAAELNVEATLRIARNACLLAGWRLWNIQGVGRAVDQVPTGVGSAVLANSTNNNLFAHGIFIGATLGWGGSADPNSRYGGSRPYILRQAP